MKKFKYPRTSSTDESEVKSASWLEKQRKAYRQGKLTKEQIRRLEMMPGWSWDENK